ncbi:MAG: hypothetical protein V1742_12025 [Pseudomonadota bacterium]
MKRMSLAVVGLLLLLFLASGAWAQRIEWEIKVHKEPSQLKDEVTQMINQDYVPLGMCLKDQDMYLLYVKGAPITMSAWSINKYQDLEKLKTGVTDMMNGGYVPTGLTYTGTEYFILFIKSPNTAEAWRLIFPDNTSEAVTKAIGEFTQQNYFPVGISAHDQKYYVLLIKTKTTSVKRWRIDAYKDEQSELVAGINKKIEEGFIPWGFDYRGETVQILYLGFESSDEK